MELSKNNRFRTGSTVDIYHTPVYETNTIDIEDVSVGDNYAVKATFKEDISIEQINEGDICAFGFGVGEIISSFSSATENLTLHSDDLTNAYWVKSFTNIISDDLAYPEGGYFGDRFETINTSGFSRLPKITNSYFTPQKYTKYTSSFYAKRGNLWKLKFQIFSDDQSEGLWSDIDLNAGTFSSQGSVGLTIDDIGIELVSDGWYRFHITYTTAESQGLNHELTLRKSGYGNDFPSTGGEGVWVRGFQLSTGNLTRYVETTTEPVFESAITDEVIVEFPKSMFPDSQVAKYVGSTIQHVLFFSKTGKVSANFTVAKYKEAISQAVYGYAKVVYNLQTQADLVLTPISMVDDGTLNAILYSKGFVLKACNDEDYTPEISWGTEFPLELSGTSIDPIYRRAYLKKREMESRSRKAKAKLEFRLIG